MVKSAQNGNKSPKEENDKKDEHIPKFEESCHVEQGTWHVATMWISWLRSGNFVARCNTKRATLV